MAELLHIYMNNPTEGGKDGTEVSSGTELSPISVLLDAGKGRSRKAVKMCRALRERLPHRRSIDNQIRR